jgi:hypothetical protein
MCDYSRYHRARSRHARFGSAGVALEYAGVRDGGALCTGDIDAGGVEVHEGTLRGERVRDAVKLAHGVVCDCTAFTNEVTMFSRGTALLLVRPDVFEYHASWIAARIVMLARGKNTEDKELPDGDAVLAAALRHAGANGYNLVGVRLLRSALAWALSTCFELEWYAVVVDSRGAFERAREYALGGLDLEAAIGTEARETTSVLFLHRRTLLERLHYDELFKPRDGTVVWASDVGKLPLVTGREYAYVIAPIRRESDGPEYENPEMACVVKDGLRRNHCGTLRRAGTFVHVVRPWGEPRRGAGTWVPGDVAVFATSASSTIAVRNAPESVVGFVRLFREPVASERLAALRWLVPTVVNPEAEPKKYDGPVYTVGPDRTKCADRSIEAHLLETERLRAPVLLELQRAVKMRLFKGSREIPAAHAWPRVVRGENKREARVLRPFFEAHIDPDKKHWLALVVTGGVTAETITAFARVDLRVKHVRQFDINLGGGHMHDEWSMASAHLPLITSRARAPRGHAARALEVALTAALERGFRMLILNAIPNAALFYLNVCARADTYQVVLNTASTFEQTRVYALSGDEGVDLEGVLSDAVNMSGKVTVAFVFGRAVLANMDFEGLMVPPPVDLDTRARLFRPSKESPLVKGQTYVYLEFAGTSATPGEEDSGYMYQREEDTYGTYAGYLMSLYEEPQRWYGKPRLAGAFVRLRKATSWDEWASGIGSAIFESALALTCAPAWRTGTGLREYGFRRVYREDD